MGLFYTSTHLDPQGGLVYQSLPESDCSTEKWHLEQRVIYHVTD